MIGSEWDVWNNETRSDTNITIVTVRLYCYQREMFTERDA